MAPDGINSFVHLLNPSKCIALGNLSLNVVNRLNEESFLHLEKSFLMVSTAIKKKMQTKKEGKGTLKVTTTLCDLYTLHLIYF